MNHPSTFDIKQSISRDAIIGHDTAWSVSNLGAVQYRHSYDRSLLDTIRRKALELKAEHAHRKHLDLTYISGPDRYIPEIKELINDKKRIEALSELAGTRLEPYPLSIVSSTVTFMSPSDGAVDWHCDGVPITELIPLEISDPIIGGELEIYLGNPDIGRSMVNRGELPPAQQIMRVPHRLGYATLGHFLGVLHRTAPIKFGNRITLVLNLRSVERPFVDDNRVFYLAADNDGEQGWINEIEKDVRERQLPAYRAFEAKRTGAPQPAATVEMRTTW